MSLSVLQSMGRRVGRSVASPRGIAGVSGGLGGVFLLVLVHQFLATFGTSLPALTGLGLALAGGAELGWRPSRRPSLWGASAFGLMHLALAVWVVLFPGLTQAVISASGWIAVETLAGPMVAVLWHLAAGLVLLAAPAYWLARLPQAAFACHTGQPPVETGGQAPSHHGVSAAGLSRSHLWGLAAGVLAGAWLFAPLLGVHWAGSIAGAVGGALFLPGAFARRHSVNASFQPTGRGPWAWGTLWAGLVVLSLGALTAVVSRMADQLMPAASYLLFTGGAALLTGLVAGERWAGRPAIRAGLLPAAGAVGLLAAFPWLVECMLFLQAHIPHAWMLMTVRGLTTALLFLPIGLGWGAAVRRRAAANGEAMFPPLHVPMFAIGFLAVRWMALPVWGVADLVVVVSWLLGGLALCAAVGAFLRRTDFQTVRQVPDGLKTKADGLTIRPTKADGLSIRRTKADGLKIRPTGLNGMGRRLPYRGMAIAGMLGLVLAGPLLRGGYDPGQSAKLLFSTNVLVARQSGLEARLLPFLDEGRAVAVVEGERGTLSAWKFRGVQWQLRESGVPKAIVSGDPDLCPQYSAELVQAVMPLVLHESPHRVLLLGLGGGVPLTTCLGFPVQEVVCAESDPALVGLLRRTAWNRRTDFPVRPYDAGRTGKSVLHILNHYHPETASTPLEDDRVRWLRLDPVLALAGRDRGYDVILSSPDQSALPQAVPCFTAEFYRRAAGRLAQDGLFCQRFQRVDYGPEPLRVAVRTMRAAFADVAAIETAPGELLLLGSNSPKGLIRHDLTARLQATHVRRALAQTGWDWAIPLNVPLYDGEALEAFAGETSSGVNTVANGRFAFRLPPEVIRWGPKGREVQQALASRMGRLLETDVVDGEDPDLLRRLTEVTDLRDLMTSYPDQPWVYRKTLRERLSNPRTEIQLVGGQGPRHVLHSEEKRRQSYLEALGAAASQSPPRSADIRRVALFAHPFDPLVSHFLHHEVADLYARAADRDVPAELGHRLHQVYFADAWDRSVRDVTAAVRLLVEHPEAVCDPADRWDHLNALMQLLRTRWEARSAGPTGEPRIVLNDIEQSISAAESAFAVMESLAGETGVPAADWQARRTVLERSLVRPLRAYRTQLLPHHWKQQRQSASRSGQE